MSERNKQTQKERGKVNDEFLPSLAKIVITLGHRSGEILIGLA